MLDSARRSRAKPSKKVLAWSIVVVAAFVVLASQLFFEDTYLPVLGSIAVAAPISAVRYILLRQKLPEPYGMGKISILDPRGSSRRATAMILGGALFFIGLLGSVFLIPPYPYFIMLFSLTGGLPLSQVLYFGTVAYVESRGRMTIFLVTEEEERDGYEVLSKSAEVRMRPS